MDVSPGLYFDPEGTLLDEKADFTVLKTLEAMSLKSISMSCRFQFEFVLAHPNVVTSSHCLHSFQIEQDLKLSFVDVGHLCFENIS